MKRLCLACLVGVLCLAPALAQTPEMQAKLNTVLFVQKLQTKEGGFLAEPPDPKSNRLVKPSLRATSAAVRALKYLGGKVPDREACAKFVAACFDKTSGGFADLPGGKVDVFTTAVGLMAVVELGLPAEPYQAAAARYLTDHTKGFDEIRIAAAGFEAIKDKSPKNDEWVAETKMVAVPPTAGENDVRARVLASKVVTLLRLGQPVSKEEAAKVLDVLNAGHRSNGGWGKDDSPKSDMESTYRVMRLYMMLKTRPANAGGVLNFVAKCRNNDNGYAVAPGQPSSVSGVYYAAIIMHWMEELK
jgi:hypothetical protein